MEKYCDKIKKNLEGYLEGTLAKRTKINTERHLKECPECSWYLREYEKMGEILFRWKVPPLSKEFEDSIISEVNNKTVKKSRSFLLLFSHPVSAGLTLFALLAMTALLYYLSMPVKAGLGKEIGERLRLEDGETFTVRTGEQIFAGNSDLELWLNDGSVIKLDRGSKLTIDAFSRTKKKASFFGEMKAEIRKYSRQEFIFRTANGDIKILGTGFLVLASKNKTIVSVFEGSVAVKSRTEKTLLTKGHMAVITEANKFITPVSIFDAIKDKDRDMRKQGLRALLEIRGGEEIIAILGLLSDHDETVRAEAASALGFVGRGDKETIRSLLKALRDRDKYVRKNAAISLGKLKVMEAKNYLIKMADDFEAEARIGAAIGLVDLGEKANAVKGPADDLNSGELNTKINAIQLLGRIGAENTAMKVVEKLQDSEKKVRWYAVCALEKLNDPRTFPFLAAAIKDPDDNIKIKAIQAVSKVFYTDGAGAIALALTETSSREVRYSAIRALGFLLTDYFKEDKQRLVKMLEKNIGDRDELLRVTALTAYARVMGRESRKTIYEIKIKDGNKIMKETAAEILKIVKQQDFRQNLRTVEIKALGKLKDKTAVPAFLAAVNDWSRLTREAAVEAFEILNDKTYLPVLYKSMKDIDPGVAEAAEKAVKTITSR
jgi:HEAT repeat protein